jgi:hypothetical protein
LLHGHTILFGRSVFGSDGGCEGTSRKMIKALFKVNLARLFGPTISVDPTVSGNNSIV